MLQRQHNRAYKILAAAGTATFAAAMIVAGVPSASAAPANHVVATSGDTFTPKVITEVVTVGDTVTFNGIDGHNATTTTGSVAAFKSPQSAASYVYTVTTAGNYTYECTFHKGMTGSFTAVAAAGGTTTGTTTPATTGTTTTGTTTPATTGTTTTGSTTPATTGTTTPATTGTTTTGTTTPAATAATVKVSGGLVGGFTPKTVHVTAEVPTTITYTNPDNGPHDFSVADLAFRVSAAGGATASKVLTATAAQVGEHKFICSISGHDAIMFGTLIVDPVGTAPVTPEAAAAGTTTPTAATGTTPPAATTAPTTATATKATATKPAALTVSGGLVSGFTPKTVHVTAEVPTTITYKNTDASDHDFTVADLNFTVAAAGGASESKVLTATAAQVGEHKFICSISGHDTLMFGTLIVDPVGTPVSAPAGADALGGAAPAVAGAQVTSIPTGGVQAGGGSTAELSNNSGLITLGGGLLVASFMSALLGKRVARRI